LVAENWVERMKGQRKDPQTHDAERDQFRHPKMKKHGKNFIKKNAKERQHIF
jgi:hypothetical protein